MSRNLPHLAVAALLGVVPCVAGCGVLAGPPRGNRSVSPEASAPPVAIRGEGPRRLGRSDLERQRGLQAERAREASISSPYAGSLFFALLGIGLAQCSGGAVEFEQGPASRDH